MNSSLMLPGPSPHLFEDARPLFPVEFPGDPNVVRPKGDRRVNYPHGLPRTTANTLNKGWVHVNQAEDRVCPNETNLSGLEVEVQRLRNLVNTITKKKDEAEREASRARKQGYDEGLMQGYEEGHKEGHKEGRLAGENNYDAVWHEGYAKGKLASEYDEAWRAYEDGRAQGYEEGRVAGRSEGPMGSSRRPGIAHTSRSGQNVFIVT